MASRDRIEHLETTVLAPLRRATPVWYVWVGGLGAIAAWGVYAYTVQLRRGLAVTGMRDVVVWGLYIVNFVFLIGISHAGTLISAILRLTHAEWRRPITRMAEAITVMALLVGGVMPLVDMGRPDRILNLVLHGRLASPILWDLISIATYLTGSLIYLYLPLIPDIALCRDRLTDASSFRRRVYALLALGWRNTPAQRRLLTRATAVMMVVIIPIAVSVHTVVSWIFAMTVRSGWDSTIFGPYFVIGAIYSGIAAIVIVMAIFRRVLRLHDYITEQHFRYLGYLLLTLGLTYAYFTFAEYLTTGYKLTDADRPLLESLLVGRYAVPFWAFAVGGTLVPIFLTAWRRTRTVVGIVLASVLVTVGMWLKRLVIVIPSLSVPLMPYEWGVYQPTWVEFSITAGALAAFALLFSMFAKVLPIISIWEVAEGWEHQPAPAPASLETVLGRAEG